HHRDLYSFPTRRSSDLRVSAFCAKLKRALKLLSVGSVTFLKRATFTVMSPAPLKTGSPSVPLISTSRPRSPSSCSSSGTNCRTRSEEHTSELQSPDHLV